jgi:diadenosine tetraphosphate (Ap4A) HIT family hydrolase
VYEDERVLAFLDVRLVNPGHLRVIPKMHVADLDTWT